MTSANMSLWSAVEATDPKHTKGFSRGGGFKGTATNATYLAKKATSMFGPVGIGWGWTVLDERVLEGHGGEKVHRVHLRLWYRWNGERGEVEQFGQTMLVSKNKHGFFTDEEAPKKSLTDAMSKCLSLLGFAADIHLGLYDDNKYINEVKREFYEHPEFAEEGEPELPLTSESIDARLDEVREYLAACKTQIANCITQDEIQALWKAEKDRNFPHVFTGPDDPLRAELISAFTQRKREIASRRAQADADRVT